MQNLLQADIFFFISSLAVVIFTVGVIVIVIYVVRILRDIKDITTLAQEESRKLALDLSIIRSNARTQSEKLKNFVDPIFKFLHFRDLKDQVRDKVKDRIKDKIAKAKRKNRGKDSEDEYSDSI